MRRWLIVCGLCNDRGTGKRLCTVWILHGKLVGAVGHQQISMTLSMLWHSFSYQLGKFNLQKAPGFPPITSKNLCRSVTDKEWSSLLLLMCKICIVNTSTSSEKLLVEFFTFVRKFLFISSKNLKPSADLLAVSTWLEFIFHNSIPHFALLIENRSSLRLNTQSTRTSVV